ncbi:MAG: nitroreductase family protein [Anaerolineales bacterium]|nr:nitroreductase family protein [Anaerolineales bacterium]
MFFPTKQSPTHIGVASGKNKNALATTSDGDNMNVSDAIRLKRAVRKFQDKPLPDEVIYSILNSGRRSQSSKNDQAWRFIAIRDKEILKALSLCGQWAAHIAGAALCVAILTPDPESKFQIMFDAGQAAAFMQLAAWEMGVGSCPASLYEFDKTRAILGYPAEWHLRIALSFGYALDKEKISAPPKKGGRISLGEIVHLDKW